MGKNTDPSTLKKAVNMLLRMLNVGRNSRISKFFRALMGIDNIPDTLQEAVNTLLSNVPQYLRVIKLSFKPPFTLEWVCGCETIGFILLKLAGLRLRGMRGLTPTA